MAGGAGAPPPAGAASATGEVLPRLGEGEGEGEGEDEGEDEGEGAGGVAEAGVGFGADAAERPGVAVGKETVGDAADRAESSDFEGWLPPGSADNVLRAVRSAHAAPTRTEVRRRYPRCGGICVEAGF